MTIIILPFKSTKQNYKKEYSGNKNNTLRKFDDPNDWRKIELDKYIMNNQKSIIFVKIINADDIDFSFDNMISDVTKFDDYYIISWK